MLTGITTNQILLGLTLAGVLAYGVGYLIEVGFYSRLGFDRAEIISDYPSTVARTIIASIVAVSVATLSWAITALPFYHVAHKRVVVALREVDAALANPRRIWDAANNFALWSLIALLLGIIGGFLALVLLEFLGAALPVWGETAAALVALIAFPLACLYGCAVFFIRVLIRAHVQPRIKASTPPAAPRRAMEIVLIMIGFIALVLGGGFFLGGYQAQQLLNGAGTDLVSDVSEPQSRIAAVFAPPIRCVTIEWVASSSPPRSIPAQPSVYLGTRRTWLPYLTSTGRHPCASIPHTFC